MIEPTQEVGTRTRRNVFYSQPEATLDASDMGSQLFERRRSGVALAGRITAAVGGVAGTAMLFNTVLGGIAVLSLAAISLLAGIVAGRYRFRCYQTGLGVRHFRKELRLRYDEITELTYSVKGGTSRRKAN